MNNIRTREETRDFLNSLQWKRMTKVELRDELREFFNSKNFLEDSTDTDCKDVDYSVIFTTAAERMACHNFTDIEIWYLPTRNGEILITGTEILTYEE